MKPNPPRWLYWLHWELLLIARSRLSVCALLLLLLLSTVAVVSGLAEVARQRQTISRLAELNEQDVAAVARQYAGDADAGNAAYFTFFPTWDAPSRAAFMAPGMRDVAPWVLRVRALGLQAQIHEGETFNPELALPGRFDFAFVLIYLAPLFAIALLHDMMAGERHAGRLRWLLSLPGARYLWWRRAALRYGLLLLCLLLPLGAGTAYEGTDAASVGRVVLLVASYLAFWSGLCLGFAARAWHAAASATALMAAWTILTLLLPTLANVLITRAIPVHQGIDLTLAQRHAVHAAWEIPRETTMAQFYASHPAWRNSPPLPAGFHWKWYFAFHQVGDEAVAAQARQYRAGLLARQATSTRLGWLLPGVATQSLLHRTARTDLLAQLAYQECIAAFHRHIRAFYYDYLFYDRPLGLEGFARRPVFAPDAFCSAAVPPADTHSIWLLLALCWGVWGGGLWALRGSKPRL